MISASLDATVRFWDSADGTALRTCPVPLPIESMACPPGSPNVAYLALHWRSGGGGGGAGAGGEPAGRVAPFLLKEGRSAEPLMLRTARAPPILACPTYVTAQAAGAGAGPSARGPYGPGAGVVAAASGATVHVWPFNAGLRKTAEKPLKLYHTKILTALAVHPQARGPGWIREGE